MHNWDARFILPYRTVKDLTVAKGNKINLRFEFSHAESKDMLQYRMRLDGERSGRVTDPPFCDPSPATK
jgi:hypothetical protein